MTNNDQDFEICLRAENVILPKYGHFGLSAATGGLAGTFSLFQVQPLAGMLSLWQVR
jgi:Legume-like lectin family.